MFCLDCGQKISEKDEACPRCGLSVSEMKERIAQAQEMVTYAETIGPASTQKLPPVPERTYKDKDGNVLRPEEKIDLSARLKKNDVLGDIPQIGTADPYVTMPIKKVVSDKGEVIADADREQKVFLQNPCKQSFWTIKRVVLVVLLVVVLIAGCALGYTHLSSWSDIIGASTDSSEQSSHSEEQTSEQTTVDPSLEAFNALDASYTELNSFYQELLKGVEEFEGYFLLVDIDSRTSHAQGIFDLQTHVTQSKQALAESMKTYKVDESSAYYAQYQQIDQLYGYLLERIDVIVSCWNTSLSYEDPRDYSQEILAPLVQDLQGGESVSETAFTEHYPAAQPTYIP